MRGAAEGHLHLRGDLEQRVLAERLGDSWAAVGRPSSPKPSGTLIAGWPVTLYSDVNGVKRPERARSAMRVLAEARALADRAAGARPAPA